jgi:2-amino-4-hydroxy-6-hydroxymethyldihydropteridine diphosphokinase
MTGSGDGGAAPAKRRAFLSLGSNLGERAAALRAARSALAGLPGTTVLAASHVYETEPQDLADQPPFLNQVVCLETAFSPRELLAAAGRVEDAAGRVREARFGPRTLDVDILLFEGVESAGPELTLPHPRLWQRAFVLVPLAELWSLARGMPQVDVTRLAAERAESQAVTMHVAEDRPTTTDLTPDSSTARPGRPAAT